MKKWIILFSILIFPYLVVVVVENLTHNILNLGYRTFHDNILNKTDTLTSPDFILTNQNQKNISSKDLIGYHYIVHFFFTSCPSICPPTIKNLIYLQEKIQNYGIDNFKIISISVDPNNDTPEILKAYTMSMDIDSLNWEFLTGPQELIYNIAKSGFFVPAAQDSLQPGGVFHSSDITIVDNKGYIRTGIDKEDNIRFTYDGTSFSDIKLLVGEIQRLSIPDNKFNDEIRYNTK